LQRVLAAMREDPEGLVIEPHPQQQQPDLGDAAKMVDAQAKSRKVDADIASKQPENAIKLQELRSNEAVRQMDVQKEEIIHAADAEKAQLDAAKVRADVESAHVKMAQAEIDSRRKTGVEMVKAGLSAHQMHQDHVRGLGDQALAAQDQALSAQQSEQEHALGAADHARESKKDENQHKVATHQALHPPKPAGPKGPSKPKGK